MAVIGCVCIGVPGSATDLLCHLGQIPHPAWDLAALLKQLLGL